MLVSLLLLAQAACPAGRELVVDVPRWVSEVRAAKPARYDELLAGLLLPGVEDAGAKSATARLLRSRGARPDVAVVVDFAVDEAVHLYRVQVLRPTRPGASCALGSAISQQVWLARRSPCPAGEDEPDTFTTVDFRFTFLDDAARAALEVVETTSQSSCRGFNGTRTTHTYWSTASDDGLRQVLTVTEASYSVAMGGGDVRQWFSLSPTAPRSAVQFSRHCPEEAPCSTTTTGLLPPDYRPEELDGGPGAAGPVPP